MNDEEFGKRQRTLTAALVLFIKEDLEAAGVSGEQLRKLTAEIAFRVASIFDGNQVMHQRSSGKLLLPVVMFADGADYDKLITHRGAHSSMHDYVHGCIDVAFKPASG